MEHYIPPFVITDKMIDLIAEISVWIGKISVNSNQVANSLLRRENRIKTIQASLAIENNTLTIEQVTAIINGKRILGAPEEIKEVKNAYEAYEMLLGMNPASMNDLLKAHGMMMSDLVKEVGMFRSGNVGVFDGEVVVHMAPPSRLVPELMKNLFDWYQSSKVHPLIKSCVFHYEFEFIHPFADGNGRIGRMWHTLLLSRWKEILAWIPIETLVKERQAEYYKVLGIADKNADSSIFIEFMLQAILDTLREMSDSDQVSDQVKRIVTGLGKETLSAIEIMQRLGLSHRATFRKNYLNPALEAGLIERTIPEKPNSSKQKYRIKKI
ncbi:MAG: Fic family protein [Eubacteriaceae bacterium]|nr:Fic family protein [Eubacteriaceae bacterium]